MKTQNTFSKSMGTCDVMVAGVALVVAASTLVSDFNGYLSLGIPFVVAVLLGAMLLISGLSIFKRKAAFPKLGKGLHKISPCNSL